MDSYNQANTFGGGVYLLYVKNLAAAEKKGASFRSFKKEEIMNIKAQLLVLVYRGSTKLIRN
jgi:hypothetical protein